MIILFTLERKTMKRDTSAINIQKNKNYFNSLLSESGIEFGKSMEKYNSTIENSLRESNYVYNEYVQSDLKAHCIETLDDIIKTYESSIDVLIIYKNIIMEEMDFLKNVNKEVIEIYEPLLKRLDRHKWGYQIPEYTLDNLEPDDVYNRVIDYICNKIGLNIYGNNSVSPEAMIGIVNRYENNSHEYEETLKQVALGVPNSYNISNIKEVIKNSLVKENNLQMKRIGDDIFRTLRESYIDTKPIDKVINLIQKEIFEANSFKVEISNKYTNVYLDSVYTNALVIKCNLITKCLEIIEDIIKMKLALFEQMCINYRKVIIGGYETISEDHESKEGIINPHNYEKILEKHSELLNGHWIILLNNQDN